MGKICKKVFCLSLFFLLSFNLAGCSDADVIDVIKKMAGTEGKVTTKDLKSSAWNTQITVSSDWKEDRKLNDAADIQSYGPDEKYVVVVSNSLQDVSNDMTVDDFANVIKESLLQVGKNATVCEMTNMTINGLPAKSFEIQMEYEKINAKFLIAAVKGQRGLYQIVTWSLVSKYDKNKEELMKVIKSFREL